MGHRTFKYGIGDLVNGVELIEHLEIHKSERFALFQCPFCENKFKAIVSRVVDGRIKSCGCLRNKNKFEIKKENYPIEYRAWRHMKTRCYNSNYPLFYCYGGRGIKVCDRWLTSFENFFKDMGERPSVNHSLDRYPNVNGDYSPENCRWATPKQQGRNTRFNLIVEYNGISKTLADWCEELSLNYKFIWCRLKEGFTIKEALEMPKRLDKRHIKNILIPHTFSYIN